MSKQITVGDVIAVLERIAPPELAVEWDAVGLALGDRTAPIETAVLSLDLTEAAVDRAAAEGASLIITHHPPLFAPVRSLTEQTRTGRLAGRCIRQRLSVYAAHTNLDAAPGGVGDALALCLFGDNGTAPVMATGSLDTEAFGFGRVVTIEPTSSSRLLERCRDALASPQARLFGRLDRLHETVAVWPGSFDEDAVACLVSHAATALVVGEMKHHLTVALPEDGIDVFVVGHGESESVVLPVLQKRLAEALPSLRLVVEAHRTVQ